MQGKSTNDEKTTMHGHDDEGRDSSAKLGQKSSKTREKWLYSDTYTWFYRHDTTINTSATKMVENGVETAMARSQRRTEGERKKEKHWSRTWYRNYVHGFSTKLTSRPYAKMRTPNTDCLQNVPDCTRSRTTVRITSVHPHVSRRAKKVQPLGPVPSFISQGHCWVQHVRKIWTAQTVIVSYVSVAKKMRVITCVRFLCTGLFSSRQQHLLVGQARLKFFIFLRSSFLASSIRI